MRINEIRSPHSIEEITELLIRDCQPFLQDIDGNLQDYLLWRGMNVYSKDRFGEKEMRANRNPLNTPDEIHNEMNKWYQKNYGHPYRNGVFCTGDYSTAGGYGYARAIFPKGEFDFISHRTMDDSFDVAQRAMMVDSNKMVFVVNNLLDSIKSGFNTTDLKSAISGQTEIILWVPEYYYLDIDMVKAIGKFLQ